MSEQPLTQSETEQVLDYLRSMDHSVLDARYEVESLWMDLRMVIAPLAKAFADGSLGSSPVAAEVRPIVEHYTTGAPDWLLTMEDGDEGWATPHPDRKEEA